MIGSQVKDRVHTVHGPADDLGIIEVLIEELYSTLIEVILDVVGLPAAQVIDDPKGRGQVYESIDEPRANKRCPTRNSDFPLAPSQWLIPFHFTYSFSFVFQPTLSSFFNAYTCDCSF